MLAYKDVIVNNILQVCENKAGFYIIPDEIPVVQQIPIGSTGLMVMNDFTITGGFVMAQKTEV